MRSVTRAIVVGGAGFFGGWLVEQLVAQGVETIVVDPRPAIFEEEVVVVAAEVADAGLRDLIDEHAIDVVFQLAGTGFVPWSIDDPGADLSINTMTTLSVLEAARASKGRPLVVFVSSAAVYGEGLRFPIDESHPVAPLSPYGVSKLAAEHYVRLYAELHRLATFSVRPFSLYGPRQRKLVVHDLLVRMLAGEPEIVIESSPDVTRDFVFVEDAARALLTLARAATAEGETYNLASGASVTLDELTAALVHSTATDTRVRFTGVVRPGDPVRWEGDASRARELGVTFDTSLADGLESTVAWLRMDKGRQ